MGDNLVWFFPPDELLQPLENQDPMAGEANCTSFMNRISLMILKIQKGAKKLGWPLPTKET